MLSGVTALSAWYSVRSLSRVQGNSRNYISFPAIASARRLSRNQAFIQQCNRDIRRRIGEERYQLFPVGIPQTDMSELCNSLVGDDLNRVLLPAYKNLEKNGRVVVVLIFSCGPSFDAICRELGREALIPCWRLDWGGMLMHPIFEMFRRWLLFRRTIDLNPGTAVGSAIRVPLS